MKFATIEFSDTEVTGVLFNEATDKAEVIAARRGARALPHYHPRGDRNRRELLAHPEGIACGPF